MRLDNGVMKVAARLQTAALVAAELFPDEVHNTPNCMAEVGREGQSCRICEEKRRAWVDRVLQAHKAIYGASNV